MAARFVSYVPQVLAKIDAIGPRRVLAAVIVARNEVVKSFTGARTGRRYRVPLTNVYYTASAPGERPAKPTKDLPDSVKYRVATEGGKIRGIVGTNLKYGKPLEMKPVKRGGRPWLEPGMKDAKPGIMRELNKEWF